MRQARVLMESCRCLAELEDFQVVVCLVLVPWSQEVLQDGQTSDAGSSRRVEAPLDG